jgi:hypothetical protein
MEMEDEEFIKAQYHPLLYDMTIANEIIEANKSQMSYLSDYKILFKILSINHVDEQSTLSYDFDPKELFPGSKNITRDVEILIPRVKAIDYFFPKEFMEKYFNESAKTSMTPFPEVQHVDGIIRVHLYHRFKWVLMMARQKFDSGVLEGEKKLVIKPSNYTKGHFKQADSFKHPNICAFYLVVRKKQSFAKTWKVSPEELKKHLDLTGVWKKWFDFRTLVIDVAKEEFKDTWVEFSYDWFPKENGKKVKEIIFTFTNGPEEEKDLPIGQEDWENTLLQAGFKPHYIKEIRQKIKTQSVSVNGFQWSVDYVEFSIKAARAEYVRKQKSKDKVKNLATWLYNGLNIGQWITQVSAERNKLLKKIQPELSFDPHEIVNVDTVEGAKAAVGELFSKNEETVSDDEYIAAYARKMRQLSNK